MMQIHRVKLMFSTKIHPYLQANLYSNKLLPLKPFQQQSFDTFTNGKNIFLNSCTGSGKTLAYLLPIMNNILNEKENNKEQNHGAIILTLNKELSSQIYRQIRVLDKDNKINVYRTGPISHYSPVVELMNQSSNTKSQNDHISELMDANVAKTIKWQKTDILISTPQLLSNIISMTSTTQKIIPRIIAIDQADLLLQIDKNVAEHTQNLLKQFKLKQKKNNINYIITASSFPQKMKKRTFQDALNEMFSPLTFIEGLDKHKLPDTLDLLYIDLIDHPNKTKDDFILSLVEDRKDQKIIIFCNSKQSTNKVSQLIKKNIGIETIQYYAGLSANERSKALYCFQNENKNIFISTDLGSRGLNFKVPVGCVIQYEMAQNIINFVNRAGRTARNGLNGQLITLVQQKNKQFFSHLQSLKEKDEQFDQLFSRKRSYRKLYKTY